MNLRNLLYISGFVLLAVLVWLFGYSIFKSRISPRVVFCTEEARLCPDGSYVSRTGPNCEFAACSGGASFKRFIDAGRAFEAPDGFGLKYIDAVDWPPTVSLMNEPFSCLPGDRESAGSGRTESRVIGGREYCVTVTTEGAAGSVYSQYAYVTPDGDASIALTFSSKFVQCDNFDTPEKTECEAEQSAFDIDSIIGPIAESLQPVETVN